jgi:hydroxyacylglutathione hydrolase
MFGFGKKQSVCTVCGYNTIGKRPDQCPFCAAMPDKLMDSKRAQRLYKLKSIRVTDQVTQLRCAPVLGLDNAAYRIESDSGSVLIDCPAIFSPDVEPVQAILFTHKDFIGAANEYKKAWDCDVCLHNADAELSEVSRYSVTQRFTDDFDRCGVHAIHIGGHSPGFTVYVWQDILFICDYAYPGGPGMKLNPHGPREATREGAGHLADVISDHQLSIVCGYNYTADIATWQHAFLKLV